MITALHNLTDEELISYAHNVINGESDLCLELLLRFIDFVEELELQKELKRP